MRGEVAAVVLLSTAALLIVVAKRRGLLRLWRPRKAHAVRCLHYWDFAALSPAVKPTVSEAEFAVAVAQIRKDATQQTLVAVDDAARVLAACTLLLEPKFLRGGSYVAHIVGLHADVKARDQMRALLAEAIERARRAGCYKALFDSASAAESALVQKLGLGPSQLTMSCPLHAASAKGPSHALPATPPLPALEGGAFGSLRLRALQPSDMHEYIKLLKQLSVASIMEPARFETHLNVCQRAAVHRITVIEEVQRGILVGCFSLSVQRQPFNNPGLVAHLEDVVVDRSERGTGLGRAMIKAAVIMAEQLGCMRVCLNCKAENATFYEKCGFTRSKEGSFAIYFDATSSSNANTPVVLRRK
ncbi:hypothetical protein AB1Y20_022913 [Prymnesium parvum]|uniref:Glucosamine 6-phosphate N-acetyltransferase n=1 Tax=Prymnesium parvum TaxID=97485 RepID=A0AB34JEL3_PRYPA